MAQAVRLLTTSRRFALFRVLSRTGRGPEQVAHIAGYALADTVDDSVGGIRSVRCRCRGWGGSCCYRLNRFPCENPGFNLVYVQAGSVGDRQYWV